MTSHFINTYASSINSVTAKLSFIHMNQFMLIDWPLYCTTVDQGCWHGLNELLHPGTETYGWGLTQQACTKYDWYGGEPVSPPSGNHLCGMFFQAYDYHWHVGDCTKPYRYICEMKKVGG